MIILVSSQLADGPVYGLHHNTGFLLGLTNVQSDTLALVFSISQGSIIAKDAQEGHCSVVCGVDRLPCPFPVPLTIARLLPKRPDRPHQRTAKRPWTPNLVRCLLRLPDASLLQSSVDVTLGLAIAVCLHANRDSVSDAVHWMTYCTVDVFERAILWLMGWPAGFKLNAPLDKFLGELYLWMLSWWTEHSWACMRAHVGGVVTLLSCLSLCGASVALGCLSDLLLLSTSHLYLCYTVSARMQHCITSLILSLFLLFRGKKMNVLKQRIDSEDYSLDQLLLGTVLFTCLSRIAILSLQLLFHCLQELLYQLGDKEQFGPVHLEVSHRYTVQHADTACFELKRAQESFGRAFIVRPLKRAISDSWRDLLTDQTIKSLLVGRRRRRRQ